MVNSLLRSYIVLLGTSPVFWKTKKQKTVFASSDETEYRVMAYSFGENWVKHILTSFGVPHFESTKLFCDSQAAIHIDMNILFQEHTKHIENDCHQVCDAVEDKLITMEHIST